MSLSVMSIALKVCVRFRYLSGLRLMVKMIFVGMKPHVKLMALIR